MIVLVCITENSISTTYPYTCKTEDIGVSVNCTAAEQQEVCGWYNTTIQCITAPCGITADSLCEACKDGSVEKVTKYSCDSDLNKQYLKRVYCDESYTNSTECNEEYLPVCGYSAEYCEESSCMKTYSNSCSACVTENVLYYISGEECEKTNYSFHLKFGVFVFTLISLVVLN